MDEKPLRLNFALKRRVFCDSWGHSASCELASLVASSRPQTVGPSLRLCRPECAVQKPQDFNFNRPAV